LPNLCFGPFELNPASGELRKSGILIKLQPQPFRLLLLLAECSGTVVTREEIQRCLWTESTFVDFEHGINFSINQIRTALADNADRPRFIETLPRRGYRFLAPVTIEHHREAAIGAQLARITSPRGTGSSQAMPVPLESLKAGRWKLWRPLAALLMGTAIIAAGVYSYRHSRPVALTEKDTIVLADFTNTTGDSVFDDTLKQALAVGLGQSPFLKILSEDKVRQTLREMTRSPSERLTRDLAREVCQRAGSTAYLAGSIAALGTQYVIGLEALNCASGDVLAREQVTAAGKEQILPALGQAASRLRSEVGESLSSVQRFDVPLSQATTNSLEALQAYTLGAKAQREKGD
jgi:DNA-binding winged helix-turn-helix (wHTH) protein